MKIGLIVAIEMDSIFAHYKTREKISDCPSGYELYRTQKDECEIFILRTGMGIAAAAAGMQYMITKFGVDVIVNFGVVGGLCSEMKKHKVCVIDRVVHYRYDCSQFLDLAVGQVDNHPTRFLRTDEALVEKATLVRPDLLRSTCLSGDKFVASADEKALIRSEFEGDVCDMESAGIVLTCEANGVPCLLLKAVSDGLDGGANEFFEELRDAGDLCLGVADEIIANLG